MYIKINLDQ